VKTIKIGNAGGFWGDDPQALRRQVEGDDLDYITIDYLAEITMSILQKQYAEDPTKGYAYDFIESLRDVLPLALKKKIKIITNAGGINPRACAQAITSLARQLGCNPKVAIVEGDNLLGDIDRLLEDGVPFANMETGEPFAPVRPHLQAANVYFGAQPVVEALRRWQPDIIVTGRVTDTGITLAAMIHELGWAADDWDRLASGIVAGHILECGSQATGGNFTDWQKVPSFTPMGFPIVEVCQDGSFIVSKTPNTGGLVSRDTVREQLVYEMGDPKVYITPDVVADFSTIQLIDVGPDRVAVSGVRGCEPTGFYKVSMAYSDGLKCSGAVLISGPDAQTKAKAFAEIFWSRLDGTFVERHAEYLGWNSCHRSIYEGGEAREILLRLSVRGHDMGSMKAFRKLIASLILSGPPGVTVLSDGLGKVQQVVSYWPALMPKAKVSPRIALSDEASLTIDSPPLGNFEVQSHPDQVANQVLWSLEARRAKVSPVRLSRLCLARSGDKGDTGNIGVLARSPEIFSFIKEHITAQWVKDVFQELCHGPVRRYTCENLEGLNFLLEHSLGGGGSQSLRADAQGKTFAQALLSFTVEVPEALQKAWGLT
jgi:hypothetical protein